MCCKGKGMMHFFFVVSKRDSAAGVRILEGVVVGGEVCDLWYCDVKRADVDVTKWSEALGVRDYGGPISRCC